MYMKNLSVALIGFQFNLSDSCGYSGEMASLMTSDGGSMVVKSAELTSSRVYKKVLLAQLIGPHSRSYLSSLYLKWESRKVKSVLVKYKKGKDSWQKTFQKVYLTVKNVVPKFTRA